MKKKNVTTEKLSSLIYFFWKKNKNSILPSKLLLNPGKGKTKKVKKRVSVKIDTKKFIKKC